jgi:hypothetical protein
MVIACAISLIMVIACAALTHPYAVCERNEMIDWRLDIIGAFLV